MKTMFCLMPAVSVCALLLGACGGGGGSNADVPAFVAGTISGLGSVVVNGVRYETIGASVLDADDHGTLNAPLGLGMTIRIESSSANATAAGVIHVQSGIQGSTSAVDVNARTLNVGGLPVSTNSTTFIVTATGLAGSFADLTNNQSVEVYGLPQSDGTFKATRIEIQTTAHAVQLVGVVSNLNTANSTFTLGRASTGVAVTYSGVAAPAGLVNGAVVSVHTATTANVTQYAATSLYVRSTDVTTFSQYDANYGGTSRLRTEANELYGMVSGLTPAGAGCSLLVQGVPTTLGSSSLCAAIQNGDYVEVKGLLVDGALTAYRVEFKTAGGDRSLGGTYRDDENDSDGDHLKYRRQWSSSTHTAAYEIYGTLSCTGSSCTLTSNGTVLGADLSAAVWEHGQVTNGWVEAKGYMASANTFKVTKIESKH